MTARHPAVRRGFTLIEMIITLFVFVLLAGAVFGIFSGTLQSVSTLQDNQARANQAEALGAWLKKSLLALPANGSVISYHREGVPFDVSDLVWGNDRQAAALDLHLQPNGRYALRLAVLNPETDTSLSSFAHTVLQDDGSSPWRLLMRNVTMADWRFRTLNDPTWEEVAPGGRPLLIQFSFQIAGGDRVSGDYWIPPLVPAESPLTIAEPAVITANP